MRKQFVLGLLLLLVVPALADQIILKNGDKLTGSITKSDGKELVIKTDYAGDVTVKFDAIQSLTSTGDLHVSLGKNTVVGPVTTRGDDVVVTTKTGGPVEAPKTSVTSLRSPDEEAAYQKSLHPGFAEGWAGGVNVGFALTTGNSETKNLNIAFNAVRKGFHDQLTLYEASVYGTNDKVVPHETIANANGGGIRYDHDFTPRVFGFVSGDFFSNSLQDLSLRSILTGGAGLHVIKNDKTTLDLLAGLNYTHESFSDVLNPNPPSGCVTGSESVCFFSPSDSSANLTLGDAFTHQLGKNTVLTQGFLIYPGLSTTRIALPGNTSEDVRIYRFAFNLGTVTKINKWLGWQNSVTDVFVSNPPVVPVGDPRIERNDLQISTGLNISFTH